MTHCDYCTFLTAVDEAHRANPEWRYGQAAFNVLERLEPELAEEVRGTVLDPFHQTGRVPEFMLWAEKRLGGEAPASNRSATKDAP